MSATPGPATLLAGVDRAAFVVALARRLREAGVPVSATALAALVEALGVAPPATVPDVYWLARLTLVARHEHLADFDRVFEAAFREAELAVDPHARRGPEQPAGPDDALSPVPGDLRGEWSPGGLPWHTLPSSTPAGDEDDVEQRLLPELLPSAVARIADTPLDRLDPAELALLTRWLESAAVRWPTRPSRRVRIGPTGRRVALRETLAASRRTGWEPFELRHHRPARRPLTVTLLVDVSQSMQTWSTAYLHLMRAFARTRRAETFAFSTSLTRLTPALSHHSPDVAVEQASEQVVDRFGGTHLAACLRELLASRHGRAVRGGVLVIASDGWDSDDPEQLAATMARAARRARRIVWLNPRAAAPDYRPLVGGMAAALPYVDAFLPADRLRALPAVIDAITGDPRRPGVLSSRG